MGLKDILSKISLVGKTHTQADRDRAVRIMELEHERNLRIWGRDDKKSWPPVDKK